MLIGLYVATGRRASRRTVAATAAAPATAASTNLTLQTVAAVGPKYSPSHPDWVSYLVKENGQWVHSTIYTVPAHSLVHVTIYQFDGDSGLRNPFLSQVQGTVGGTMTVDGKAVNAIDPEEASHTFVVPQLGVFVPLPGVPEEAKNQCEFAPCEGARRTGRSPSRSAPARRAATAGSASCPARPGPRPASAARCRRSATWTASSMSSSRQSGA